MVCILENLENNRFISKSWKCHWIWQNQEMPWKIRFPCLLEPCMKYPFIGLSITIITKLAFVRLFVKVTYMTFVDDG